MREKSFRVQLPIYESYFEVVVSDSITKSVKRKKRAYLGNQDMPEEYTALHCYNEGHFSSFFTYKDLSHNTVAHEIFHATMRIAERAGIEFRGNNHEPFAYLHGYLFDLTYKFFKKNKIQIKCQN